ncbi:PKD domain-containing protein [Reichenbachiella versicolor]|uniref:PKD domain-containing protein n=1 Tax=Reichenbachiella versicolor TaxID=1821036 RepID=UPI000D6E9375|nr:PKD domain-containing protein [Reichenbachiella versicolor]
MKKPLLKISIWAAIVFAVYLSSCNEEESGGGTAPGRKVDAVVADRIRIPKGDSVKFKHEGSDVLSRLWSFDGGDPQTSTIDTLYVTYEEPGDFVAHLTVDHESGDRSAREVSISVLPDLQVAIEADADVDNGIYSIAETLPITFTDLSIGEPDSYEWTFIGGNPETSSEQNPTVTYETEGEYNVRLKISRNLDGMEMDSTITGLVTVTPVVAVTANFESGTLNGGAIDPVYMIDVGGSMDFLETCTGTRDTYEWEFPGSTTATASGPEVTGISYFEAGRYDVTLTSYFSGIKDTKPEFTGTETKAVVHVFPGIQACGGSGDNLIGCGNFEAKNDGTVEKEKLTADWIAYKDGGGAVVIAESAGIEHLDTYEGRTGVVKYVKNASSVVVFGQSFIADGTSNYKMEVGLRGESAVAQVNVGFYEVINGVVQTNWGVTKNTGSWVNRNGSPATGTAYNNAWGDLVWTASGAKALGAGKEYVVGIRIVQQSGTWYFDYMRVKKE